jgi:hypothetical protein
MKKLLILMLVLGLASMATAALVININGSDPGGSGNIINGDEIQVMSTNADTYLGYVFIKTGSESGSLANGAFGSDYAGDQRSISAYSVTGYGAGYKIIADYLDTATPTVSGEHFVMDFSGGSLSDTGVIDLYHNLTVVDSYTYTVVPEPMTIALLGLGGLLLRRRK